VRPEKWGTSDVDTVDGARHSRQSRGTSISANYRRNKRLVTSGHRGIAGESKSRRGELTTDQSKYVGNHWLRLCTREKVLLWCGGHSDGVRSAGFNVKDLAFNVKDLAMKDEVFFSLLKNNTCIQCFSCGIILTKFLPDIPSFVLHLLASPSCKHLHLSDDTNKPNNPVDTAITYTNTPQNNTLTTTPETRHKLLIQEAGFTYLKTIPAPYYKYLSCHGIYKD